LQVALGGSRKGLAGEADELGKFVWRVHSDVSWISALVRGRDQCQETRQTPKRANLWKTALGQNYNRLV
jgi:hypothetical protein